MTTTRVGTDLRRIDISARGANIEQGKEIITHARSKKRVCLQTKV